VRYEKWIKFGESCLLNIPVDARCNRRILNLSMQILGVEKKLFMGRSRGWLEKLQCWPLQVCDLFIRNHIGNNMRLLEKYREKCCAQNVTKWWDHNKLIDSNGRYTIVCGFYNAPTFDKIETTSHFLVPWWNSWKSFLRIYSQCTICL